MPNYSQLFAALTTSINQRVTSKNTTDSIDPVDVGGSITDVLSTILPILNTINEFNILGGNAAPTNGQGIDGDIYIQDGVQLSFWKKTAGAWVLKRNVNLGINIVDGNINLQSRISGLIVTVSAGQWGINNVIYSKAVQTQFTVPAADANFDRIDAIFADQSNVIHYVSGTASANPDTTKPSTPTGQIIVEYIYVPSDSSGNLPYISDSNAGSNIAYQYATSGSSSPISTYGTEGDLFFEIPVNNAYLKLWQKLTGGWQVIFDLPLSSSSQSVYMGMATQAEFVDDGFGEGGKKLILPFTGTQITIAEISRSSTGVLLKQSAGGSVEEINGLTSEPQILTYWYVGEPEEG